MKEILTVLATSWAFWLSITGLIVIVIFLFIFRSPISALIARTRRIAKDHIDTSGQEQKVQLSTDPKQAAEELLAEIHISPQIREVQQYIEGVLKSRNLPIDTETSRVLLGYTAAFWVALDFQRIYNAIFGSQIMLLTNLNSKAGATREELEVYYKLGSTNYPEIYGSYSFDEYLGFLLSQSLLLNEGAKYKITLKGRNFLVFMVNLGLSQTKAG